MPVTALFKRLNLKEQTEVLVLDAPDSFEAEVEALDDVPVYDDVRDIDEIAFALVFVMSEAQVEAAAEAIAPKAQADAIIWFAYPKITSKRYRCDFDRDTGWAALGELGFEGVRQVALDADWSALRFRRVNYTKTVKRDPNQAQTQQRKARVEKKS
ncbi:MULTISPECIES: hypothetical protein [unclassified Leptolyngbya]|uniref:hypothetical protein n=1 Tax=unclassified Leptolyngbya TaxID=2650499 RepID=UPI0016893DF6|nr:MULTISPECIES: hypothetical protein [unclassified Leptolyngbya]MBD1912640.1 hypothetical protein [Leptolyngbya sp. FACHB-8]MBD2156810.1 hypothetical protein [Leptolyngbya sp. FACHB-16]